MNAVAANHATGPVAIRGPRPQDGRRMHALLDKIGGLERNTGYAYVLVSDHFSSTSVVAEEAGHLVGFVAAYLIPSRPDTVFVWQVGVHPGLRGRGVGRSLLRAVVDRPGCTEVGYLEATVAPSNTASRRLFESFASTQGAEFNWSDGYPESFFENPHEPERLIRIGPFGKGATK